MTKHASTIKSTNGQPQGKVDPTVVEAEKIIAEVAKEEVILPMLKIEPEVVAEVVPEVIPEVKKVAPVIKEMTMMEKILKVENLSLVIEKRAKLVQTRSELDRFQTASNDFNCSLRLNDSDGNVFTSSFTPGIKKVVDFLKQAFDESIEDVEKKITF